jgi:hypothetical protein
MGSNYLSYCYQVSGYEVSAAHEWSTGPGSGGVFVYGVREPRRSLAAGSRRAARRVSAAQFHLIFRLFGTGVSGGPRVHTLY